jgi:hypothetical protein
MLTTNPGRAPKVCFSDFAEGLSYAAGFPVKRRKLGRLFPQRNRKIVVNARIDQRQ